MFRFEFVIVCKETYSRPILINGATHTDTELSLTCLTVAGYLAGVEICWVSTWACTGAIIAGTLFDVG